MGLTEVIKVEGLGKRFGEVQTVDQVTFSVQEEEIFGFLGPNGAGKTTTIRMLVGLLRPDLGSAWVDGYEVEKDPVRGLFPPHLHAPDPSDHRLWPAPDLFRRRLPPVLALRWRATPSLGGHLDPFGILYPPL